MAQPASYEKMTEDNKYFFRVYTAFVNNRFLLFSIILEWVSGVRASKGGEGWPFTTTPERHTKQGWGIPAFAYPILVKYETPRASAGVYDPIGASTVPIVSQYALFMLLLSFDFFRIASVRNTRPQSRPWEVILMSLILRPRIACSVGAFHGGNTTVLPAASPQ